MSEIDPDSGATIPEGGRAPFPDPGETPIDVDAQAQSRVLSQYRESTKLRGSITDIAELFQALEDVGTQISQLRDPAIAGGVNLDDVGELVGQSRVLVNGTVEGDTFFRTLIAQRILRNKSIGSSPEYITAVEAIFGSTPFRYVDLGGMAVLLELATGGAPHPDLVALLDFGPVPRAMAVGVGRGWYDPASYFGFVEDPSALGFGEIGDPPPPGGQFGEIF